MHNKSFLLFTPSREHGILHILKIAAFLKGMVTITMKKNFNNPAKEKQRKLSKVRSARMILCVFLFTLIVILTGCMKMHIDIVWHDDNSATVSIVTGVSKSMLSMLGATEEEMQEMFADEYSDEDDVVVTPYSDAEYVGVTATTFVDDVRGDNNDSLDGLIFESFQSGGVTTYSVRGILSGEDMLGDDNDLSEYGLGLDDLEMKICITMPGRIIYHNAPEQEGNKLLWDIFTTSELNIEAVSEISSSGWGSGGNSGSTDGNGDNSNSGNSGNSGDANNAGNPSGQNSGGSGDENGGTDLLLWILIGVGAVIIISTVIIVIVISKKKKIEPQPGLYQGQPPLPQPLYAQPPVSQTAYNQPPVSQTVYNQPPAQVGYNQPPITQAEYNQPPAYGQSPVYEQPSQPVAVPQPAPPSPPADISQPPAPTIPANPQFCQQCGVPLNIGSVFCSTCGTPVS